ncbi:MAG: serine hydrolase [Myxococcota bacterium]
MLATLRTIPFLLLPILVVNLAFSAPPRAAAPTEIAGRYKGSIQLPSGPLDVDVVLSTKPDGTLTGTISIPAQNARDLPLSDFKRDGDTLAFSIAGVPGSPRFEGKLTAGKLAGSFTQGGGTFPFSVEKRSPRAEALAALAELDRFIEQGMTDWAVPGVAIGVVKDGEVVLSKGYGLRDVEKKLPVTTRSLFAIGSTTKAFTATVLGTLVDEGKLDWEKPVAQYLPGFTMKDPYATLHITPRDLVTHTSGLPRHDLVWYNNLSLTRGEVVRRLRYLEPNKDLLRDWQYNNIMFMTAGYLAEHVTGKTWEQAVRDRILTPLQMTHTNFSVKDSAKDADHAEPYDERDEKLTRIPFRDITTAGPAGSINSCVDDMNRWLLLNLSGGAVDGKRVVSTGTLQEIHTPRAVIAAPPEDPAIPMAAYASGWFVDVYRGHRRIHHGGNIDGFSAEVMLFPDTNTGIVVLVNRNATRFPIVLARTMADRLLGLPARDWNKEGLERLKRNKALRKESKDNKGAARVEGTHPSLSFDRYVGRYQHPGYGPLEVLGNPDALSVRFNNLDLPLEHWHYDVFRVGKNDDVPEFEGMLLKFQLDGDGQVQSVGVPLEAMVGDIVFERQPDARLSDPKFLAVLAGSYDLAGKPMEFSLRGNVLMTQLPGQPALEMVPARGISFTIKGINGYRAEFVLAPDGKSASEVRLYSMDGMISAKRIKGK